MCPTLPDEDKQAIRTALRKFRADGVITPTTRDEIQVISPIYVLWRDRSAQGLPKKARLIYNAKSSRLNAAVRDEGRFSLPGFSAIRAHVAAYKFHVIVDIEDAFTHVPVKRAAQRLLGIQGPDGDYYTYAALPFGLKTSPFLYFSTIRAAVDVICRRHNIDLVWYMDDFLISAQQPEDALRDGLTFIRELRKLGWRINTKKCHLIPSQRIRFLGFVWDSRSQTCELPPEKVTNLTHDLKRTARLMRRQPQPHSLSQRQTAPGLPLKLLHSLIGKLTAAQQAVQRVKELLRLPLRVLRRLLIKQRTARQQHDTKPVGGSSTRQLQPRAWRPPSPSKTWSNTALALELLASFLRDWNGKSLQDRPVVLRSQSDASPTYCGAVATFVDRPADSTRKGHASHAAGGTGKGCWRRRPPRTPSAPVQRKQELYDALSGNQRRQIEALARPDKATLQQRPRVSTTITELSWPVPPALATAHITRKETFAAVTSLIFWTLHFDLRDGVVVTQVDNTATLAFLNRAHGRNEELETLAAPLHLLLASRNLEIRASYIRSAKNKKADDLSRPGTLAGARLAGKHVLRQLMTRLAAPTPSVDLFATKESALCRRFASPLLGYGAIAQSAFLADLEVETGSVYMFPPPRQMAAVVTQLLPRLPPSGGVVIAPFFPRRPWFPRLLQHATAAVLLPAWAIQIDGLSTRSRTRWIALRVQSTTCNGTPASLSARRESQSRRRRRRQPRRPTTLYGDSSADAQLIHSLHYALRRSQQ
jgi:hypothetical protein